MAWVAASGKDLNWDQLNYHFYIAFSFVNDRLSQDFLAANVQSLLNPLSYVPFYLMVSQGWSSLLISSVLAAAHALSLIFIYLIGRSLLASQPYANAFATLGAGLALLSPIFLIEVGTSFADITTAILLIGAVLVGVSTEIDTPWWRSNALAVGVLVGAAGGLKLSNLVFAPAFALMFLVLHLRTSRLPRTFFLLCTGGLIGIVLSHGFWSWKLYQEFSESGASLIATLTGTAEIAVGADTLPGRFRPESFAEALALPFKMVGVRSWIYIESVAPDLRFAATICFLALSVYSLVQLLKRHQAAQLLENHKRELAVLVCFLSSLVLWIATSANGRYGIFVSMLCGPILAVLALRAFRNPKLATSMLVLLTAAQLFHLQNGQLRWVGAEWTNSWYEPSIPERLKAEPSLYISLGGNSASYVAPFLHPQSVFTNPIGQMSVELDGPGGERLSGLIEKWRNRTRVLAKTVDPDSHDNSDQMLTAWADRVDIAVARLGLAIDLEDCDLISTSGSRSPWEKPAADNEIGERAFFRTCRLVPRPYEHAAERDRIRHLVNDIVAWCPRLFGNPLGVVEQTTGGWSAVFSSTDNILMIQWDRILISPRHSLTDINLGSVEDWKNGYRPSCAAMPVNLRKAYGM